jgi:hypothetical protein
MRAACAFELLGIRVRPNNLHNLSRASAGKLLIAAAENAEASTHSKAAQKSLCSARLEVPERRYVGDNNGCARKMFSNVAFDELELKIAWFLTNLLVCWKKSDIPGRIDEEQKRRVEDKTAEKTTITLQPARWNFLNSQNR